MSMQWVYSQSSYFLQEPNMPNYRVCTHTLSLLPPTCSYLYELMFRALNTVNITFWTLHAGMCKHTPSEDGQHTDQNHTTQYKQRELDYEWVTLGYDTSQYHNIAVLTQHRPAAHPVLALLSKAQTRALHHHPVPAGKGKSWRETCVRLSSACQQCPRQQGVRIHTGITIFSSCGTRGQKRQAKQAKAGGVTVTWGSQPAEELVMKRCHTCHCLSLPKTLHSAVLSK